MVLRGRRFVTFSRVCKKCRKSCFCGRCGAILLRRFQKLSCIFRGRRSTLETSIVILRGRRSTSDVATLYTLHFYFTLHTFHSTLYTPHSTLFTPHSTLQTPHFTLHTLHSTLYIPHFTLYTLHSTLHTLHSTLYTLHSTLHTLHSTLFRIPQCTGTATGKHAQDCPKKMFHKKVFYVTAFGFVGCILSFAGWILIADGSKTFCAGRNLIFVV